MEDETQRDKDPEEEKEGVRDAPPSLAPLAPLAPLLPPSKDSQESSSTTVPRSGISYAMLSPFEDRKAPGRGDDSKKDHASVLVQQAIESSFLQRFDAEAWEDERTSFHLSDALVFVQAGVESLSQDDFTECFTERPPRAWNWNPFLFAGWVIGVLIRHVIFLPLRLLSFLLGSLLCACAFPLVWFFSSPSRREKNTAIILVWWARVWVLSIGAVISVRGVIPGRRPNQIWVANHSTPLDFAWLLAQRPCASVGQLHGGFIGFWQTVILRGLKCIWFQRFEANDRLKASERMRAHAANIDNPPLVLFPEGVCVNNEYCVMFRKGAFELGCEICPIAIKYDKSYSDPYWSSKQEGFFSHIVRLMTYWCVVIDVHFLETEIQRPDETSAEFADRVKSRIASKAGLINVPWDGYLKYYNPSERFKHKRQTAYAAVLLRRLERGVELRAAETQMSVRRRGTAGI